MFSTIQNQLDDGVFVFSSIGNVNDWIPFSIPTGYKNISITCIGAGGGGGGAYNANTLTRAGGAGGGSGAITTVTYPLKFIPPTIYLQPGIGGSGGASGATGAAGTTGGNTYVSLSRSQTNASLLSFAQGGGGGGGASSATAATAGTGGTIATVASVPYAVFGNPTFIAGVNGGAGGAGTTGTPSNVTAMASSIVTGGAGGAGAVSNTVPQVGASVTGAGIMPTVEPSAITYANNAVGYYSHVFITNNRYIASTNFESTLTPTTTGDFTIEFWWYHASTGGGRQDLFHLSPSSGFNRIMVIHDGTNLAYATGTTTAAANRIASAQTLASLAFKWNHVALSRVSGTSSLYLNGTRLGTFVDSQTWSSAFKYTSGKDPAGVTYMTGRISNARYLIGTGLYSGTTITVPTSPLTAVNNTKLLVSNDSTTIDNGPNAIALTEFNSVTIDKSNPFNTVFTNLPVNGSFSYKPLSSTGGAGGPSLAYGTSVGGGDGGFGSGGGGSGSGTFGGSGGRGGDGLVILSLW